MVRAQKRNNKVEIAEFISEMRRLHGMGLSDSKIVERMGTYGARVFYYREKEGLLSNGEKRRRYNKEEIAEFIPEMRRLHGMGLSDSRIAERMGSTQSRVHYYRAKEGLLSNGRRRRYNTEETDRLLKEIRELYAEGLTDKQIRQVLQISKHSAVYYRRKLGLAPNSSEQKRNREKLKVEVLNLHARGLTDQEIAKELGMAYNLIRWKRYNLGLERNLTPEEKERNRLKRCVWDLYRSGRSYSEIAEELGIENWLVSKCRLWMMSLPEGSAAKIGNE